MSRFSELTRMFRGFLRGMWSSSGSVAQKTVRGATWGMAGSGGLKLFGLAQIAILARLLSKRDFGIMQLATVTVALTAALGNFGISTALVQRKEISREYLDTAWILDMARNLLMFGLIQALAWPVSVYYGEPLIANLVRVISIKPLLMAFRNVGIVTLYREMDFRRKQIYDVVIDFAGSVGTIALALILKSVWALAIGQVIYGLGELIGSYIISPFRPRFKFNKEAARNLLGFGKHVFFSGVLDWLRRSLVQIILPKFLDLAALGVYSQAIALVRIPTDVFNPIFSSVLYPAFARIQNRIEILRRGYLRSLAVGCLIMCPALAGIAVTAGPVVRILYGPKWADVPPFAAALCLAEFIGMLTVFGNSMLLARGRPGLNNITSIAGIVTLVPVLWLFTARLELGIMGAIGALTLAKFVEWFSATSWVKKEIGLTWKGIGAAVGKPLAASLVMAAGVLAIQWLFPAMHPAVAVAALIASGVVIYLAASSLLNRDGWADAWRAFAGASQSDAQQN